MALKNSPANTVKKPLHVIYPKSDEAQLKTLTYFCPFLQFVTSIFLNIHLPDFYLFFFFFLTKTSPFWFLVNIKVNILLSGFKQTFWD